jgi:hypothetical protein
MRASAIRHLAVSSRSSRAAAAFFEHTVQIWDLREQEMLRQFETALSFGGNRLALDPGGEMCVTAGWEGGKRGGVACYAARSGKILWHRVDLRHTQRLRFSSDGENIWCVPDAGPTKRLDSSTGKTRDSIAALRDVFESPNSVELLLERRKRDYLLRAEKDLQIPRLSFAILDAAFGPESLCISEAGGLTRCFDSSNGVERWRYDPGRSRHLLRLWYRGTDSAYYGVQWEYERGRFRTLVRLDGENGRSTELCQLTSWAEEYCVSLDCLVTSGGELLKLSNGRLSARLAFAQADYPDQKSVDGLQEI